MSIWCKPDGVKVILFPFFYLPVLLKPKWVLSVFASRFPPDAAMDYSYLQLYLKRYLLRISGVRPEFKS